MCNGDPALGWKRIEIDTAKRHLLAINLFADWLTDNTGAEHPNPLIEKPMSWIAHVTSQIRRSQSDLLGHLLPATREGKRMRLARTFEVPKSDTRRLPGSGRPAKVFSFEDYNKLIIHEAEPRNLLLWLLLGAGGLRVSEPMHLFPVDILFHPATREARVRFFDPQNGPVSTVALGRQTEMTRKDYLRQKYNLVPRDALPDTDIMWAGWKGMRMTNPIKALLILVIMFHAIGCATSHVTVVITNKSKAAIDWVHLECGRKELSVGVLPVGASSTTFDVKWPTALEGKVSFVDDTSRTHYVIPISLRDVTAQNKTTKCRKLIFSVLDHEQATVECE
jgi:hypothetical protein